MGSYSLPLESALYRWVLTVCRCGGQEPSDVKGLLVMSCYLPNRVPWSTHRRTLVPSERIWTWVGSLVPWLDSLYWATAGLWDTASLTLSFQVESSWAGWWSHIESSLAFLCVGLMFWTIPTLLPYLVGCAWLLSLQISGTTFASLHHMVSYFKLWAI